MAKIPPTLQISPWEFYSDPFLDVNKAINVFVACGRKSYYQTTNYWKEFVNIQEDCTIDGFKADTIAPSSINIVNQGDNFVIVYPNPAKDKVTIEGEGDIIVTNNFGQIVYKTNSPYKTNGTNKPLTMIDVSNWESGIYYVKVGDKTKKLVIE